MEGENPTRRYKWFRPRQAARGFADTNAGSNFPTYYLFNNSTAAQYLVVRAISGQFGNGLALAYVQGNPGVALGTITPLIPGTAALPGLLTFLDAAAAITPDGGGPSYQTATQGTSWNHEFPIAILPPNWSLAIADLGGSQPRAVSVFWEAIFADELDFWN
jgi:hypothetical protein